MKINKKTIIILIVVAVAVFLLWKKGVFGSKTVELVSSNASVGNATDSVEGIISISGMKSSDASYVRNYASRVESSLADKAFIEDQAEDRGFTYNQMLVLSALWTKYCCMVDGVSKFKEGTTDATKNYYWKVTNKIMNL